MNRKLSAWWDQHADRCNAIFGANIRIWHTLFGLSFFLPLTWENVRLKYLVAWQSATTLWDGPIRFLQHTILAIGWNLFVGLFAMIGVGLAWWFIVFLLAFVAPGKRLPPS